jgi:hypothetical protein
MKAKVKATGEVVEVYCDFKEMKYDFLDETGKGYMSNDLIIFDNEDYEQGWNDGYYEATSSNHTPDYWTRLEHKATIAAMQGVLANNDLLMQLLKRAKSGSRITHVAVKFANACAHTFVEKLKEKEERK